MTTRGRFTQRSSVPIRHRPLERSGSESQWHRFDELQLGQGRPDGAPQSIAPLSGFYPRSGKRLLDLSLGSLFFVASLPVLLPLLLLASLDGHTPIYRHERVGRDGRLFRCLKIRTMVPNSDEGFLCYLERNAQAAHEWELRQKLAKDPRVTWFGRFLRATSLDELPQLWNVLRGEMSLVGPRPVTPNEILRYGQARDAVLSVRPGLTGAWQVFGRGRVSYAERVEMDLEYVKSISLRKDLRILLGTVRVVLAGASA